MKKVLSIIVLVILVIVFTPVLGNLYETIIGRNITAFFIGPSHPEYFEGFFMSLMLFVSIWFGFTINKGYLIILGLVLLVDIFLGVWDGFVINIVTGMIGIALGFLAKYISIKIIPKKKMEGGQ